MNEYMQDNKNPTDQYLAEKRRLFERTAKCIDEKVFGAAPPSKLSLTVVEGVLYGVSKNIDKLEAAPLGDPKKRFDELLAHPDYSESALREGLAKKPRVLARLATAESIFAG